MQNHDIMKKRLEELYEDEECLKYINFYEVCSMYPDNFDKARNVIDTRLSMVKKLINIYSREFAQVKELYCEFSSGILITTFIAADDNEYKSVIDEDKNLIIDAERNIKYISVLRSDALVFGITTSNKQDTYLVKKSKMDNNWYMTVIGNGSKIRAFGDQIEHGIFILPVNNKEVLYNFNEEKIISYPFSKIENYADDINYLKDCGILKATINIDVKSVSFDYSEDLVTFISPYTGEVETDIYNVTTGTTFEKGDFSGGNAINDYLDQIKDYRRKVLFENYTSDKMVNERRQIQKEEMKKALKRI